MNLTANLTICIALLASAELHGQNDSIAKALVESPPNGVFYSFSDFMNGTVSMRDSVTTSSVPRRQKIWKGTESVTPRNSYHKRVKRINQLWGFADGSHVYVWNELDFFPFFLKGDTIGFEGYGPYNYNPDAYTAYSMLFGGFGAIAYTSSLESKAESARTFYWFDFEEKSRSGANGFKAYEHIPDLSCRVILYRRSKKEKESGVKILLNDSTTYEFIPDSYKTMQVNSGRLLKVCLDSDPKRCSVIDLGEEKIAYV